MRRRPQHLGLIGLLVVGVLAWIVLRPALDRVAPDVGIDHAPGPLVPSSGTLAPSRLPLETSSDPAPQQTGPIHEIAVLVQDESGVPIPDATIRDGDLRELAVTNASGDAVVGLVREPPITLITSAAGFAHDAHAIDGPPPRALMITLSKGVEMRGRIVLAETREPVSGATVITWPSSSLVTPIGPGADGLLRTTSLADGTFSIVGLPSDTLHSVVAVVGEGLVSTARDGVDPTRTEVELAVEPVYGAWIHLRSDDGEPPVTSEKLVGWGPTFSTPKLPGLKTRYVASARSELRLIGVPEPLVTRPSRYDAFVAHSLARIVDELPPTSLSVYVPGYEEVSVQIVERRIDLGIPEYTIELPRRASGFGELTVSFDPWPEDISEVRSYPIATVELEPMDGTRLSTSGVLAEEWPSITLDRIPHGAHQATMRASNGLYVSTRIPVTIGAVPAAVHFATRDTGSLRVRIVDRRGRDYAGWAILRVRSAAGVVGSMSFDGPPFVISFLPVDEYTVTVKSPSFEADGEPVAVALDVFGRREVVISGTFTSE